FEKRTSYLGPLGEHAYYADGYYMFPKLEGQIGSRMVFDGRECLIWSLNNYLGLANHPEVRKADTEATEQWGLAYPMGARMMSGHTSYHEKLEAVLADFVNKEAAYLLNYGYQGMLSIIDALVDRNDVIVYDNESHACIIDGMRLHMGKRFVYPHNDMKKLRTCLQRATKLTSKTNGGILVITEGVYGMSGDLGKIDEIVKMKKDFKFRLLIDDAHGFGTMGPTGAGTDEHFGVQNDVDLYFGTFAKAIATIGAFVAGDKDIINYLKHNMRSQIFAKSLPMPITIGALKRMELIKKYPELREKMWTIAHALQDGLRNAGISIGNTESVITPVMLNGTIEEATKITREMRETYNIFCSIVTYPVVPKGVILLRLIPTATHSIDDVNQTVAAFTEIKNKLEKGAYKN
ncbi:MAG: aminotransferase class I/II-fold pyridoxal phosphate-dependent enzyme, partial [Lentimicrobiaceae bacterium]|nr:aminotransferase class I/II-fold pyridoxal phosphate-dependent enzyme [Lentimicrobiaceae bacterium]